MDSNSICSHYSNSVFYFPRITRPESGPRGQQGGAGPAGAKQPEAEEGLRKICEGATMLNNAATKNKLQVKLFIIDL